MLALAHKRMGDRPDKYVDHIYGEKELGGTSVLYLSSVPFEKLGFPTFGEKPFPRFTAAALGAVPPAVMAIGAMLGAAYAYFRKRVQAVADGSGRVDTSDAHADHGHHVAFERLDERLMTPFNWVLLILVAFCGLSMIARFARGLGGSTHLSDTYPWGLWILFDLVWIAVAAGAFAMAGAIYVFQRKDLYGLGRKAVLMGLLSYSFVTVTLVADLGLPWHFYQLGLQSPDHSAMFEVSWCVGLYVTILAMEFLPVVLERFGLHRLLALWQKWSGAYVAFAVTLFIFMMSRNLVYAAVTAVIFGTLAWLFRARDKGFEPILLAIAAVTLSTMHQSSLGSLYLLMPNMLASQWWSPVMPVSFFLSSIVAGSALVILIDMWIAKGWRRPLDLTALASVGQITFWSMLVYLAFRLGDMALRGQLAGAFPGRMGLAFAAEIVLGGLVPLALLASRSLRSRPDTLFWAALLAVLGVAYNRMNVVLFAMTFRGRMPWGAPQSYAPSIFEWGISIGLIAATIFLFGLGARLFPVLPRQETSGSQPLSRVNTDGWLAAHLYLQPIAHFCAQVDRAAAGLETGTAAIPDWDDYAADFREGVPLLQSSNAAPDLEPAGRWIVSLVERLAARAAGRRPGDGSLDAGGGPAGPGRCLAPGRVLAARRRFDRAGVPRPAATPRMDRHGTLSIAGRGGVRPLEK